VQVSHGTANSVEQDKGKMPSHNVMD